jgi:hypothetical protein
VEAAAPEHGKNHCREALAALDALSPELTRSGPFATARIELQRLIDGGRRC